VPHVELSLSGAIVPPPRTPVEAEFLSSIERWAATVTAAAEPCLIIDDEGAIRAVSPAGAELLGLGKPVEATGRRLIGAIVLIDFTASAATLEDGEADKIPPLLAVRSRRLARGLMRVLPEPGRPPLTLDAVSTPLFDADRLAGSMTFFSAVQF
jgi:PAS domain-containing protein